MTISELIEQLEERLSNYGDIEVKFANYDGNPHAANLQPVQDVTVEAEFVVLWDK